MPWLFLFYLLCRTEGKPIFSVRQDRKLYSDVATDAPQGRFSLEARLEKDGAMTLSINEAGAACGKAPGVFAAQPADELSIGEDTLSAVGDYVAPRPRKVKLKT